MKNLNNNDNIYLEQERPKVIYTTPTPESSGIFHDNDLKYERMKRIIFSFYKNDYLKSYKENEAYSVFFERFYLRKKLNLFRVDVNIKNDSTIIVPKFDSKEYFSLKTNNPELLVDILNFIEGKEYFLYDSFFKKIFYIGPGAPNIPTGGSPIGSRVEGILKNGIADDYYKKNRNN